MSFAEFSFEIQQNNDDLIWLVQMKLNMSGQRMNVC